MKLIYGPRCSGKSYELVRMAHETDQYIITPTRRDADYLRKLARNHDMPIRNPVSVEECIRSNFRNTPYARLHHNGGVLVDDAGIILSQVLRLPKIQAVTVCARESLELQTRFDEKTLKLMAELGDEIDE